MMIIAHLSDLHIRKADRGLAFGRIDTTALAEKAIEKIEGLRPRPDIVVITGDLTDCGRLEEYQHLRAMLDRLSMPVHLVLGNHDVRANFLSVFPEKQSKIKDFAFVQECGEYENLRVIGLDTLVAGEGHGELCAPRLQWLRERLSERPDTPTIILTHHAPFKIGSEFYDTVRLTAGSDALKEIVEANKQIVRFLCGHHHRAIDCLWAGTLASIAPAVVNANHLELGAVRVPRAIAEPAAFKLHVSVPGYGFVSHTAFVDDFGGPFEANPDPEYPALRSFLLDTGLAV
ncbi:phosphodiesterase [Rhizobium sp. ZPR3]|uniref:Phosphodiesterase n=2 Tax=unclassified Rhizobium TaxID=2613769 RepID=A0AAU7SR06_9HYPH